MDFKKIIKNEEIAIAAINREYKEGNGESCFDQICSILDMKDQYDSIISGGRLSELDPSWVYGQRNALPAAIGRKTEQLGYNVYKLSQTNKRKNRYGFLNYFNEKSSEEARKLGKEILSLYNVF